MASKKEVKEVKPTKKGDKDKKSTRKVAEKKRTFSTTSSLLKKSMSQVMQAHTVIVMATVSANSILTVKGDKPKWKLNKEVELIKEMARAVVLDEDSFKRIGTKLKKDGILTILVQKKESKLDAHLAANSLEMALLKANAVMKYGNIIVLGNSLYETAMAYTTEIITLRVKKEIVVNDANKVVRFSHPFLTWPCRKMDVFKQGDVEYTVNYVTAA